MKSPTGWRIRVGTEESSILAEVMSCQQAWQWLTKAQREAMRGADDDGKVVAGVVVLRNLRGHGLVDEADLLTPAGRLVLGWNDEESGAWRERMKELRAEMGRSSK